MAALEESLAAVKGEDLAATAPRRRRPPASRSVEDSRRAPSPRARSPSRARSPRRAPSRWRRKAAKSRSTGTTLKLTNLDKVLYPKAGFTKGEVIDYYARVADAMLPHLRGRAADAAPLPRRRRRARGSLLREALPQAPARLGEDSDRDCGAATPARSTSASATTAPTLIWLAQLAALELHPSLLDRRRRPAQPTVLAFDLDPGAPADVVDCCRIALRLRDDVRAASTWSASRRRPARRGFRSTCRSTPRSPYDETKPFAKAVAQLLEKQTRARWSRR